MEALFWLLVIVGLWYLWADSEKKQVEAKSALISAFARQDEDERQELLRKELRKEEIEALRELKTGSVIAKN